MRAARSVRLYVGTRSMLGHLRARRNLAFFLVAASSEHVRAPAHHVSSGPCARSGTTSGVGRRAARQARSQRALSSMRVKFFRAGVRSVQCGSARRARIVAR